MTRLSGAWASRAHRAASGSTGARARTPFRAAGAVRPTKRPGAGPLGDGKFYCLGKEYGYCDRRSGTCFCSVGYQGASCGDCTPTHFKLGARCVPKRACPGDCSGAGACDYRTGTCTCESHREGPACDRWTCGTRFHPRCVPPCNAQCKLGMRRPARCNGRKAAGVAGSREEAHARGCGRRSPPATTTRPRTGVATAPARASPARDTIPAARRATKPAVSSVTTAAALHAPIRPPAENSPLPEDELRRGGRELWVATRRRHDEAEHLS